MAELKLYERLSCYIGPDYDDYYVGLGRSRDSDVLEECNFNAGLEMLSGEAEDVLVIRDNHWAVGWVETIYVHKDSPKVKILQEIKDKLEDYPVLDEGKYSEAEMEDANEAWENFGRHDILSTIEKWTSDETIEELEKNEDMMCSLMMIFEDRFRDTQCGLNDIDEILNALEAGENGYEETKEFIESNRF